MMEILDTALVWAILKDPKGGMPHERLPLLQFEPEPYDVCPNRNNVRWLSDGNSFVIYQLDLNSKPYP